MQSLDFIIQAKIFTMIAQLLTLEMKGFSKLASQYSEFNQEIL